MAYTLEDEDGFLGHGPSINGLRELKTFFATQQADNFPALTMLLIHGATHLTTKLAVECRTLSKRSKNKDVASSLSSLAIDAGKAKGAVILAA